jgi:hypothetical protein
VAAETAVTSAEATVAATKRSAAEGTAEGTARAAIAMPEPASRRPAEDRGQG